MSQRRAEVRGFTLLEMLVATALVAVLAGSLYASLSIAFKARRSAMAALEPVRRAEIAMALVGADIRSAVIPNGVLAQPFLGDDATDTRGHDADVLMFCGTASSPEPAEGVGDIKRIEISCEASDDGQTQVLVRRVTTNLLSPRTLEPPAEVLCRGVFAFNIRYFDGSDWLDGWDSTLLENTLPLALEVTLQLDDPRQIDPNRSGYSVSQVVLVPCGALPPDSTTQGTGSSP